MNTGCGCGCGPGCGCGLVLVVALAAWTAGAIAWMVGLTTKERG
jgi:hypothetical protein